MPLRVLGLLVLAVAAAGVAAGGRADAHRDPATPAAASAPSPAGPRPAAARVVVRCPVPAEFRSVFAAASRATAIPTALILAVARIESSLRPDVRSPAGAFGLLQLMPSTASELRVDARDPGENVLGGARYLRSLVDRFGSVDLGLAAYFAGPTAVSRARGVPTEQAAGYVDAVNAAWRELGLCE